MKHDDRTRWVFVKDLTGDFEINFKHEPTYSPTLKVEIFRVRHKQVFERTWTYNKKSRRGNAQPEFQSTHPPGKDWTFEKDDGQSTLWVRRRDDSVALVWHQMKSARGARNPQTAKVQVASRTKVASDAA